MNITLTLPNCLLILVRKNKRRERILKFGSYQMDGCRELGICFIGQEGYANILSPKFK